MRYIPNSPEERREMLRSVGLESPEELFSTIPADILLKDLLAVPPALSEMELLARFESLAAQNSAAARPSFLGAGAYSHYSPTIVDALIQRSEFFTAYTPYQPEVSQGTLQAIFEFQTLVCQLTGMEVANASMYDGSTGLAEAVLMAERVTRRRKVLVSPALHPEYLRVAETYVEHAGVELQRGDFDEGAGLSSFDEAGVDSETAALVVQSPNFFGCVEEVERLAEVAHKAGALLVVCVTEAISLAMLKSPGACGADIVVAEGQSFGVPLSFGGPYVGLFATREKYARQIPGRLVGVAHDKEGRRGFVLTLATREQHIRREKATSNICTNEGLIALAATIYLETMGRRGLQEVAGQCAQKAAYAARRIGEIEGFSLPYSAPRFNEFVARAPLPAAGLLERIADEHNITGGLALSHYFPDRPNDLLVCVTETNRRSEIDALVAALRETRG
ncbi:MAG: aminomethyl-transferring glycine dehydrogenase subunit GcvPA [Acidobacteria bacterium]|nr:aminomethyl-transferring glycine dehydrogenase subunit GcvPA [Acidobacteriota bacterium]MCA1641705.1 aminomethyl-transferring glycine dehydrogenase subunit GcvPA [Acidobacteriota bacterium]